MHTIGVTFVAVKNLGALSGATQVLALLPASSVPIVHAVDV
jgi:hypothetical protein